MLCATLHRIPFGIGRQHCAAIRELSEFAQGGNSEGSYPFRLGAEGMGHGSLQQMQEKL